jgi:radical SAM superfamily enzyme YgiQ (UPF0313 family)
MWTPARFQRSERIESSSLKMNVVLVSIGRYLEPIGLKALHAYLHANGHTPWLLHVFDTEPLSESGMASIRAWVRQTGARLAGVSLMSQHYDYARRITRDLNEDMPELVTVWGGIHPTIDPDSSVEHAHFACIGEGERTLLEMADRIERNEALEDVPNLAYLRDGNLVRNPLYPLIEDLDALPLAEHVPTNAHVLQEDNVLPLDAPRYARLARFEGRKYCIITSRGCPFCCTYCCNDVYRKLYGRWVVRRRSIPHIIGEIEKAMAEHPQISHLDFHDDCFLACDMEYLREFCAAYKARVAKPFIARSTPATVTPERMALLKEAGMTWVCLGLQSGSDKTCHDVFNRRSTAADFLRAAQVVHDSGIAPFYDVILDNPFESDADRIETARALARTPRPFYTQIFSLTFYGGTELRERALRECPELIEDPTQKDFIDFGKGPINDLIATCAVLHRPLALKLTDLYERAPRGFITRAALSLAKTYCMLLLGPITWLRVIHISEGHSLWRTLSIFPYYVKEGLRRYWRQIRLLF